MSGEVRCSRCGEGFHDPRDLALHRGRVHAGSLDEAEQASFEVAVEEEAEWLTSFRRRVRAGLAALAVVSAYAVVLVAGYVHRAHPAFMFLPLPGILGFAGLAYYMVYRRERPSGPDASEP
jgi:hypothetical protein